MSDPIDPVSGVGPDRRSRERRARDRRSLERRAAKAAAAAGQSLPGKSGLPVPVAAPSPKPAQAGGRAPAQAAFAAQLIGQGGQKRGLKGGPPVLEEARSAYLGAEWSGPGDRRTRRGRITETEI